MSTIQKKSPFRFEDPFKKDRDLIYEHIGLTKRITWNYQYFSAGFLTFAILIHQLIKLFLFIKHNHNHNHQQQQRYRVSFIHRRIIQCQSFLGSKPPTDFLFSWFGTNSNMLIIIIFYLINLHITFYKLPMDDSFNLSLRFGLVSASNLPLLYLIPLKNGPLLYLLNQSYENILVFHKSVGLLVILTALIHTISFCYCLTFDYLLGGIKGQTGLFCIGFFIFIGITSTRFIKERYYELFYFMHIVNFLIFLPVFYFHHYVCKPFVIFVSGLLLFDRVIRYFTRLWVLECKVLIDPHYEATMIIEIDPYISNLSRINRASNFLFGKFHKFGTNKFTFEPSNHLFITIPIINLAQSHPFTIASLPNDDKVVLIVKVYQGFTKRLFDYSKKHPSTTLTCLVNGPYGLSHELLPRESIQTSTIDYRNSSTATMTTNLNGAIEDTNFDEQIEDIPFSISSPLESLTKKSKPTYQTTQNEPTSNQSSFSSLVSANIHQDNSREKIVLIAGGTGISLILPLLKKYESNPMNFDISLIWIIRNKSILNLPYINQLHQDQIISTSDDHHVKIWETNLRGRPIVENLLFDVMPKDYVSKLHIIGCGPNLLMESVRQFAMNQKNQFKDPYTEINLILEEFSF